MARREARERTRRRESEERVHTEPLAGGEVVGGRAEGVTAEQHLLLGPPERDLAPEPVPRDRHEDERRPGDALERPLAAGDTETRRRRAPGAAAPRTLPKEHIRTAGLP